MCRYIFSAVGVPLAFFNLYQISNDSAGAANSSVAASDKAESIVTSPATGAIQSEFPAGIPLPLKSALASSTSNYTYPSSSQSSVSYPRSMRSPQAAAPRAVIELMDMDNSTSGPNFSFGSAGFKKNLRDEEYGYTSRSPAGSDASWYRSTGSRAG